MAILLSAYQCGENYVHYIGALRFENAKSNWDEIGKDGAFISNYSLLWFQRRDW